MDERKNHEVHKVVTVFYPSLPPTDDRSHVIERSLNRRSGEEERKQDFINLDESEFHWLSWNLDCLLQKPAATSM